MKPPRLSEDALEILVRRDWPGNVRELESVLTGAILRDPGASVLGAERLGDAPPRSAGAPDAPAEPLLPLLEIRRLAAARTAFERLLLLRALRRAAGNRVHAARELGISRQALWQKLRRYGIG